MKFLRSIQTVYSRISDSLGVGKTISLDTKSQSVNRTALLYQSPLGLWRYSFPLHVFLILTCTVARSTLSSVQQAIYPPKGAAIAEPVWGPIDFLNVLLLARVAV